MNIRQACFAELVATGMPVSRAYFEAGYSVRGERAQVRASRLLENSEVAERIVELRGKTPVLVRMSKTEKLEFLEHIITSAESDDCDRIAAIKIHNQMVGDNEPTVIVVEAGPETLKAIREGTMSVETALGLIARSAMLRDR